MPQYFMARTDCYISHILLLGVFILHLSSSIYTTVEVKKTRTAENGDYVIYKGFLHHVINYLDIKNTLHM